MDERDKFLATLEACHEFPGPYTFKIIGENGDALYEAAREVLGRHLPGAEPEVSRRESGGGKHQSITFVVEVPSAVAVHDVYAELRTLSGLKVLL